jgi:nicotinamidase-related amidase
MDMEKFYLSAEETVLVVVDIQERLATVMEEREKVVKNTNHLIELANTFGIPVIVTEQYPKGLGHTVPEIRLPSQAIEKLTFDCCGEDKFLDAMDSLGRQKAIVVGMETHVCVLQTVLSLIRKGYVVHAVSDAICSRNAENKKTALDMMAAAGAVVTCTESVLFLVMKVAGTEEFKKISKMIR